LARKKLGWIAGVPASKQENSRNERETDERLAANRPEFHRVADSTVPQWNENRSPGIIVISSLEPVMGVIERLVRHFEDLIARYNAAVDHSEAWKRSKLEPLSKFEAKTASELRRRSSDA
jgi:hypothetical protein